MDRSDLEYIRTLNDKIEGGLLRIEFLKNRATSMAINYDDSGASKPMPSNKLEAIFCEIDKEERRVDRLIDKRAALMSKALRLIRMACPEYAERHILYLRYFTREPLKWNQIVLHVNRLHNISERRIYQLHHVALIHLESYNM